MKRHQGVRHQGKDIVGGESENRKVQGWGAIMRGVGNVEACDLEAIAKLLKMELRGIREKTRVGDEVRDGGTEASGKGLRMRRNRKGKKLNSVDGSLELINRRSCSKSRRIWGSFVMRVRRELGKTIRSQRVT